MNPELKNWVKNNSVVVKNESKFTINEVKTQVKFEDKRNKVRVVSVGPENEREVKAVLLLGETGVGKTTFLNTFLNMVFGVHINDDIRLQLKDQMDQQKDVTQSQTEYTTAFIIYHQEGMPYPYNYMIIDTPGLGDTEGDQRDMLNQNCLRFYLTNENYIKHLNCVGLVWKSSNQKLDARNSDILQKIKKLLGFDIKAMTDILLTFSTFEDSSAITAIQAAGMEYKEVFFFENSPLYQCPAKKGKEQMHQFMWDSMVESHEKFMEELNQRQAKDLKITAQLLLAQAKLEDTEMRCKALNQSSSMISNRLENQQARMIALEDSASRVDWDKIQDLDTSAELIPLDDGRHCHYCRECKKVCITDCTLDHVSSAGNSASPMEVDGAGSDPGDSFLGAVDKISEQTGTLATQSTGITQKVAGIVSEVASAIVRLGRMILGVIRNVTSEGKTQGLHASEGDNECPVCQHPMRRHEVRDKILAKDANFQQKMELLKKKKYNEVMGQKTNLEAEIQATQKMMEEYDKQTEEEMRVLQERKKEVEKLQKGE